MQKIFLALGAVVVLAVLVMPACDSSTGTRQAADLKTPPPLPAPDLAQKVTPPPAPTPAGPHVVTSLVLDARNGFGFNATWLTPNARKAIDDLMASKKVDLTVAHFEIEGHTDNVGTPAANQKVALARADAVRRYLVFKYEVDEECVKVVGVGPDQPVADNDTDEGRAQNRRVVIKVLG